MAEYSAIYRDYRPERFEDVIGQDAIVRILKNQISTGRIGHAYLFSGLRGTGKTTTARIFAKAVNCENGGVEPCCTCSACQDIKKGTFMDVVEMDAASNNGVDDIRSLREELNYPPVRAKKKIYIIDEVHMLSTSAANAFLKVLEEPPEYVIFILATTDPQKLPKTILSRCTRLDFRRVSEEDIIKNMMKICEARGMKAEPEALAAIAEKADGSVRDSLSILEQCMFSNDTIILEKEVNEIIGIAGRSALMDLTARVMEGQISEALLAIDRMLRSGVDAKDLLRQWLGHFRNLLLAKFSADPAKALEMSEENINRLRLQGSEVTSEFINRGIAELTKTIGNSRTTENSRVLLEMCAVRLALPQESEDQFRFRQDKAASFVETYADALARAGAAATVGSMGTNVDAGAAAATVGSMGTDVDAGAAAATVGSMGTDVDAGAAAATVGSMGTDVDAGAAAESVGSMGTNVDAGAAAATVGSLGTGIGVGAGEDESKGGRLAQDDSLSQGASSEQSPVMSNEDLQDLWLTAVKKAAAEKMLLTRIETRSRALFINDGCIYVHTKDLHTEKALFENGKELIEQKLEMYYGSHLSIVKGSSDDAALAAKMMSSLGNHASQNVASGIANGYVNSVGTTASVSSKNGAASSGRNGAINSGRNGAISSGQNGAISSGQNGAISSSGRNGAISSGQNSAVSSQNGDASGVQNGTMGSNENGTASGIPNGVASNSTNGSYYGGYMDESSACLQARHVAEQINEKFHLMPEIVHESNGGK